jgi:glycosyltransferase involved in cell wall biosynthesis
MEKRISVAVNSWDCLDGLKLFVKSFLDNTYDMENTELCIALDGSPEESLDYVQSVCGGHPIECWWTPHAGLSASLNRAFELCSHEYVLWASDDYVFMPEWDRLLRKYLHPDHYVSIHTFEPSNSPFPSREGLDYPALMSYLASTKDRLSGELGYAFGNGAFSTEKMRAVGGFEEGLTEGSMDGDFIYSMHKAFPELIFFRPGDVSFYHFSRSTRGQHPELLESVDDDTEVFERKHGHERGCPLYMKIKEHCADKSPILAARGIVL